MRNVYTVGIFFLQRMTFNRANDLYTEPSAPKSDNGRAGALMLVWRPCSTHRKIGTVRSKTQELTPISTVGSLFIYTVASPISLAIQCPRFKEVGQADAQSSVDPTPVWQQISPLTIEGTPSGVLYSSGYSCIIFYDNYYYEIIQSTANDFIAEANRYRGRSSTSISSGYGGDGSDPTSGRFASFNGATSRDCPTLRGNNGAPTDVDAIAIRVA